MLLRVIVLSILSAPVIGHAQYLSREFVSVGGNACSGVGIVQLNSTLTQNMGLGRKHRAHLLFGARASYIRNSNDLVFSPQRSPKPDFSNNSNSESFGTLNLLFGFKICLTRKLSIGANTELLGITFGSTQSGRLDFGGNSYEFDAKPMPTNFLLNGQEAGNLFHAMEVGYLFHPNAIVKVGVASQSIMYNYRSNLDGFGTFTRSYNAIAGYIGIEWIISCKK
jgi:hypothetical protein